MKVIKSVSIMTLLLGSAFVLEGYRENRQLDKDYFTIKSSKINNASEFIRVGHISDTQFPRLRVPTKKLLTSISNEKPDILFFTGDTIDRTEKLDESDLRFFLSKLTKIAPTYIVTGNHEETNPEYDKWLEIVKQSDAILLENDFLETTVNQQKINIVGLSNKHVSISKEKMTKMNHSLETLILAHHPEKMETYMENFPNTKISVFSGHAHGGQVILPVVGGLYAPDQGFLPEHTDGHYEMDGNHLFVSRGLANSSFPARINNYPHLIFVDIKK